MRKKLICKICCVLLVLVVGILAAHEIGSEEPVSAATVIPVTQPMQASSKAVDFITSYEGCYLRAYDDLQPSVVLTATTPIKGTLTIGYGHIGLVDGKPITWDMTITKEKAKELFYDELVIYVDAVNQLRTDYNITLNQDQFDALVSFCFNVGQNKFRNGSVFNLKTYLVNGVHKYSNLEVEKAFLEFNTAKGQVLTGLTRRRKAEAAMFLGEPAMDPYSPTQGVYEVVIADELSVRSDAGTKYSLVGTVKKGTLLSLTKIKTDTSVGGKYWGYNGTGWVSLDYCALVYASLDTPVMTSITVNNAGIQVCWEPVKYAAKYRVYRKDSITNTWKAVGNTTDTEFVDKPESTGNLYYYTVRCISSDERNHESGYHSAGMEVLYQSTPELSEIVNRTEGQDLTWTAVPGVSYYRVYCRNDSGQWEKLADTTKTSYRNEAVVSGKTYTYTVRCLTDDCKKFTSGYDAKGIPDRFVESPVLQSATNGTTGVTIQWKEAQGAQRYRVYRKNAYGTWERLGDTTSTGYTDKNVVSGKTYTYTVRCLTEDCKKFTSGYDAKGISVQFVESPVLQSATNGATGVKVQWKAAQGAQKYRVYRKNASGTWERLGDTTSTGYTDKNVVSGKTYTYTVRCISADGKIHTSSYNSKGITTIYLAKPQISLSSSSGKVKISWKKISGATGYNVYRKTVNGTWKKLANVVDSQATGYTDGTGKKGTTYYYTVRAVNGNYLSTYVNDQKIKVK